MVINSETGKIVWAPTAIGIYPVIVKVEDEHGASTTQPFSVTVTEP
jgi:hypothetical protein